MKKKNLSIQSIFCLFLFGIAACGGNAGTGAPAQDETLVTGNPAIDQLTAQLAQSPNSSGLYAARGNAWYENENYDEAIADLEKAISLDSAKVEYYHLLADIYMDYYKSRQALLTMKKAMEKFPTRVPTLLKLAEFQLILEQHNDALYTLEKIRGISPLDPEMFFMFGRVFKDMGRTDESLSAFQSAVENNPKLTEAWVELAVGLAEKGSPLVDKYFDNALRIDSNNITALHAKAHYLSNKKNDLKGAIQLYKKIITLDQQYVDGYFNSGLIYLDMDSLQSAYQSFDIAVKYAPQNADAHFHRGMAAEMMGNKPQALADYKNTLNLDPDYASAKAGVERLGK